MKSATLRKIVITATVLMALVLGVQLYWLKKTYALEEKQFNVKVSGALRSVVEQIHIEKNNTSRISKVIEYPAKNYYIANIKYHVDSEEVESLLKEALEEFDIFSSFKFGIYNVSVDTFQTESYVKYEQGEEDNNTPLPLIKKPYNYIGVMFPNREKYIISEMDFWIYSTIALLLVIMAYAITVYKLLRQKQLAEIHKDFINNMTHEFRTPISNIQLSAEVFKQSTLLHDNHRLFTYANIIDSEINRLKDQVDRVLVLARMEQRKDYYNEERINVHDVIYATVKDFQHTLLTKAGSIELVLNASYPFIIANKLHFTNILYNLIDNAIKFSHSPIIYIITERRKGGINISIQDNGIGIPEKYHKYLFKKFFRVPAGDLQEARGFGLGLNYVYLYTKAFDGKIDVKSEPGKGTTFTLYFPVKI